MAEIFLAHDADGALFVGLYGCRQVAAREQAHLTEDLVLPHLTEYEGKKFKSVGKGTVELGTEEEKKKAKEELEHFGSYQYLVVNNDLDEAYEEVKAIYLAAHCALSRRAHLAQALIEEGRGG